MLNQREVVSYLLARKLISPLSIVEGDVLINDLSARNHNYAIISKRGPSYLLKQGVDLERRTTIAHEAAIYTLLQEDASFRDYLPGSYGYDQERSVLVLEWLRNGQSLREYQERRGCVSLLLARRLGEALATLHHVSKTARWRDEDEHHIYSQPPGLLSLHRPDQFLFEQASPAHLQLMQRIQSVAELSQHFDTLCRNWTTTALIHGDMRWENCIVCARPGSQRKTRLRLVDWELAAWGDPCWDIASVLGTYLDFWVFSLPIIGDIPTEQALGLARYPLEQVQQGMYAFWQAYVKCTQLSNNSAGTLLMRSLGYTAAKLIQIAFERTQHARHLTKSVEALLHLSVHIVQQPLEMVIDVLGFPLQSFSAV